MIYYNLFNIKYNIYAIYIHYLILYIYISYMF